MATILRLPRVLAESGKTRSPLYADIAAGLWTRPIKLSARAAGWPEYECDELIAARIAGQSDAEIRKLVDRLHAARKDVARLVA